MAVFDQSALVDRAAALVAAAKAAGADAADAVAVRGVSNQASIRDGVVEDLERSEGDDLGLRVFIGTRSAIVSTNDMDAKGYAPLAERAVAMARAAPENPHAGLADPERLASGWPDLDLLDDTECDGDTLIAMAREAEAAALAVDGVSKSGGASASASLGGLVLATSAGFSGSYLRSGFGIAMTAICGDGTAMERDYDWSGTVHLADLDAPADVGRVAARRALRRTNPKRLTTRSAPVVFENRMAGSLIGTIASAANGAAIVRGSSYLADRLGDRILPAGVTVTDDPLVPRGRGSRPFDAEGVGAAPLTLIDDGRLANWILDSATARELGLVTNGRAGRGVTSAPSPSTTNLTLPAGTESLEAMIARLGTGLLVTAMFGRGANIVTGDYSRGVSGLWFENGEIAYPVSEITIAGHLDDMLGALAAADDLEIRGAVNAPSLFIGEMTIAGE